MCIVQVKLNDQCQGTAEETKGHFERMRLCALRGSRRIQQLLQYVHDEIKGFCSVFLYSGNFLTLTVFLDLLKLAREDGWLSQPIRSQDSRKEKFK
jgi:hypothetical protein